MGKGYGEEAKVEGVMVKEEEKKLEAGWGGKAFYAQRMGVLVNRTFGKAGNSCGE